MNNLIWWFFIFSIISLGHAQFGIDRSQILDGFKKLRVGLRGNNQNDGPNNDNPTLGSLIGGILDNVKLSANRNDNGQIEIGINLNDNTNSLQEIRLCPESNPYSYKNGAACCKHELEHDSEICESKGAACKEKGRSYRNCEDYVYPCSDDSKLYNFFDFPDETYSGSYELQGQNEPRENWVLISNRRIYVKTTGDKCIWYLIQSRQWVMGDCENVGSATYAYAATKDAKCLRSLNKVLNIWEKPGYGLTNGKFITSCKFDCLPDCFDTCVVNYLFNELSKFQNSCPSSCHKNAGGHDPDYATSTAGIGAVKRNGKWKSTCLKFKWNQQQRKFTCVKWQQNGK